jgi:hypothetical protein
MGNGVGNDFLCMHTELSRAARADTRATPAGAATGASAGREAHTCRTVMTITQFFAGDVHHTILPPAGRRRRLIHTSQSRRNGGRQ